MYIIWRTFLVVRSALNVIGEQNCTVETMQAYIDVLQQPGGLGDSSTWDDDVVSSLGNLIGLLVLSL